MQLIPTGKRKIIFAQQSVAGTHLLTSGYALHPGVASSNNKTSMVLLWCVCVRVCVRGVCFLCMILFFILEKEYKVGWVGS